MEIESMRLLATGLTVAVGVMGPGIAVGLIGTAALNGIARNPEATSKIQTNMILAIAFAESLAIYALVIALIIKFA
ncbi:MAG: ATP synthase F0 subunit C [Candidatus Staskawiczbacteria bacterium]|nr:ATP synthase F0 subunit C [Candidatus Staskawiczbacteria bacterium]